MLTLRNIRTKDFTKNIRQSCSARYGGNEQYQIFAAFTTPVYTGNDFDYYSFIKAGTVDDYKNLLLPLRKKSLYQTGTTAKYRDKLLTLSTCEYSQKNGRMVLVAKKNNGKE